MAERERWHREVFVGTDADQMETDAREAAQRFTQGDNGWHFQSWYYAQGTEHDTYTDDPDMLVLILWLAWRGEQQSQAPLWEREPRATAASEETHAYGGWNEGTRVLNNLQPSSPASELLTRVGKLEKKVAEQQAALESLSKGFASLRDWLKDNGMKPPPEVFRGLTGEIAQVSPGPRDWGSA